MSFYAEAAGPRDLYVRDLKTGKMRQITHALNPAIDPKDLVEAKVVRFKSYDGVEIPGLLYQPLQASPDHKVPALVWVHGGPGGQSRIGYSGFIQFLVNHGYAVYAINNRGSSGYGKTFYTMDDRKHGDATSATAWRARRCSPAPAGWTATASASSAAATAATWSSPPWPSSPRSSRSASTSSASPTGCARWRASPPGGDRAATRSTRSWAIRRPTPTTCARSRPSSTPTRSSAAASCSRARTIPAC